MERGDCAAWKAANAGSAVCGCDSKQLALAESSCACLRNGTLSQRAPLANERPPSLAADGGAGNCGRAAGHPAQPATDPTHRAAAARAAVALDAMGRVLFFMFTSSPFLFLYINFHSSGPPQFCFHTCHRRRLLSLNTSRCASSSCCSDSSCSHSAAVLPSSAQGAACADLVGNCPGCTCVTGQQPNSKGRAAVLMPASTARGRELTLQPGGGLQGWQRPPVCQRPTHSLDRLHACFCSAARRQQVLLDAYIDVNSSTKAACHPGSIVGQGWAGN